MTAKPKNLLQLAYSVKNGDKKLTDLPERMRNRVRSMADSMTKEQLQAAATPAERKSFKQFTAEKTRKARAF